MANEVLVAFCTFPDAETAGKAVRELVQQRFVACGNIIPQIHSIYLWHDTVESNEEVLAIMKLEAGRYPEFETKLKSLHPYEVPEIIAFPVTNGLPSYLEWVTANCSGGL